MLSLGIETSCDETAVALVDDSGLVCQKLATQIDVHAVFGGVVPEIASREHLRLLPVLYRELLADSGVSFRDIDVVSVARGPGLLGALLVGVSFAKALSMSTDTPLIGVNHLWAHLLAPGLERELKFPALGLLVSGGHTHTYFIESPTSFRLLGKTLDDAAGEAFDKVAKLMNFPYPGGKYIDMLGQGYKPDTKRFPRPYVDNPSLDFSFSGLKTAVANYIAANGDLVLDGMGDPTVEGVLDPVLREKVGTVCASFNWSVAETLRIKVERAFKKVSGVRSLIVAGGVAANSGVRSAMAEVAKKFSIDLTLPSLAFCTDNAAMIAYAGRLLALEGYCHPLTMEAIPRGRVIPEDWERCPAFGK